ncbi:hypothetical protein CHARACLAT_005894 [Characodon lateralis]|uniref:Uncharacterized protein n=1 Tax=Characodon lateralis TaxID=208331 RepID=A0ABU7CQ07_9TELE|nr:hypothetical protein [Characodon lateralis]
MLNLQNGHDLNPVENVWTRLNRQIYDRKPTLMRRMEEAYWLQSVILHSFNNICIKLRPVHLIPVPSDVNQLPLDRFPLFFQVCLSSTATLLSEVGVEAWILARMRLLGKLKSGENITISEKEKKTHKKNTQLKKFFKSLNQ